MKQNIHAAHVAAQAAESGGEMSEHVWETFDGLFKTVYRQERRVAALEERIAELEQRLLQQRPEPVRDARALEATDFPAERAA